MNLRKIVPRHLFEKKTMIGTVIFIISFSIIFMYIFTPFSNIVWFRFDSFTESLIVVLFYLVSILFLSISKSLLYKYQLKHFISQGKLLLWVLSEVVVIAFIYTLFYKLFLVRDYEMFGMNFLNTTICVFLILLIPYIISVLYISIRYKRKILERLGMNVLTDYSDNDNDFESELIHLTDNTGKLKMSLNINSLYYVKSHDNYVKIYYESQGKLSHYMLRSTISSLEEKFGNNLLRCHRSFLVNRSKIKFFRNERNNMAIELLNDKINPIPVSKNYSRSIHQELIS